MKLHSSTPCVPNVFTRYGPGYVFVNAQRFERSVLVLPEGGVTAWQASSFEALAPEHFSVLLELPCEVVLLGTGSTLRFPRAELLRPLTQAGIGVEVMDVQAACRTFNILAAEGRKVAAALLLP